MAFFITIKSNVSAMKPMLPFLVFCLVTALAILLIVQKVGILDALMVAFIPIGTFAFGAVCVLLAGTFFFLIASWSSKTYVILICDIYCII
jgi:hypothetical protein